MNCITRRDVEAGRVAPKTIENGVVVPPALQINALSLAQLQVRLVSLNLRPLSRAEAEAMAFAPDEIATGTAS